MNENIIKLAIVGIFAMVVASTISTYETGINNQILEKTTLHHYEYQQMVCDSWKNEVLDSEPKNYTDIHQIALKEFVDNGCLEFDNGFYLKHSLWGVKQ